MDASASTLATPPVGPGGQSGSETAQVRVQLRLREMVLSGELQGGSRIAELAIVDMLGVSRTPIRAALLRLEQEGLLEALPHGGYAVRTFTERDVSESIELRGTIEGLLARFAAERGAPAVVLREARECLEEIDGFLKAPTLSDTAFTQYVALNERFHRLLREMAGSQLVAHQLDRVMVLPFASPSAFVIEQADSPRARDMLIVAQDQHWQVLDAIEQREGARAESVMREHSRIAQRNLRQALRAQPAGLPGVRLIRRRG